MAPKIGSRQTPEHRAKISASLTGRTQTAEHRANTSASRMGHAPTYSIHGLATTPPTVTYTAWANMRGRCRNPNHPAYARYGGRGILVCASWDSFETFLADMGERPEWATGGLDRINNDGNYEPGNCRWATLEEQGTNKSHCPTCRCL